MEKIKVLVVDDSAFMRVAMRKMIEIDKRIEVVDTARNGEDAIGKVRKLKPDLVTMDIEMPVMDGLTALEHIMDEMPLPVIMISSHTEEGADATFKALDLGAVDYIPKTTKESKDLDIVKISEQLRQKVVGIVLTHRNLSIRRKQPKEAGQLPERVQFEKKIKKKCDLVVLGISTGGPMALQSLMPKIPRSIGAGIVIVQHMPLSFTGPFAKRLDDVSQINVKEAEDYDIIEPGCAYVARGGIHLKMKTTRNNKLQVNLDKEPSDLLFIPSVDVMMLSAANTFRGNILGVIMTGMGNDGLQGMTAIKKNGGITIAQDETSCIIYGMPKACVKNGIIDHVVPLDHIANEITGYLKK